MRTQLLWTVATVTMTLGLLLTLGSSPPDAGLDGPTQAFESNRYAHSAP